MQELPDDNQMDELFRKSAEAFDPPYDPTAWQDMAARLDRHDRATPSVWLRRGLAVLLLAWLTGNYGWFSSSRPLTASVAQRSRHTPIPMGLKVGEHTDNQTIYSSVSKQNNAAGDGAKQPDRVGRQPAGTPANTDSRVLSLLHRSAPNRKSATAAPTATATTRPDVAGSTPVSAPVVARHRIDSDAMRGKKQTNGPVINPENALMAKPGEDRANSPKQTLAVGARNADRGNRKAKNRLTVEALNPVLASGVVARPSLPGEDNDATRTGQTSARPVGEMINPGSLILQAIDLLPIRDKLTDLGPNRLADNIVMLPIVAVLPDTTQPMPVTKPIRPRRFVVGAVFSPDLSTIGLRNFDRPGTNLGLSVQYQVTPRFSIQTGVLYSQKNYRALASQYVLPTGLKWGVWPSSISGDCRMIDLPINVRYDVFLKKHPTGLFSQARWFVSAGVTAYWIEREAYQYNYANPNDPNIKYRNWETSTGRQGISNLNVSLGYERQLNRRFSVQAEPFLKMPLRDIGAYKIRLISTGVFMSVRYRF